VVAKRDLPRVTQALEKKREKSWIIGRIVRGRPSVKYVES
jgi:phosphoribosylaminoimidazole (AIR) synthetase